MRFRFRVTWSTLLDPSALQPAENKAMVVTPLKAANDSNVEWAMVIPKLGVPRLLPAVGSGWTATFAAPKYVIPKFEVSSGSSSLAVKLLLSVSAALLLIPGWTKDGSPAACAIEMESSMRESGWARESASQTRQLVLYRAVLRATDYRLDFTWRITPHGVTCVFRATDRNNYYGVRIKPLTADSSRSFSVERFAVIRGTEKSRAQRVLTPPGKGSSLHAALDVTGPLFRLYLEGNLASQWTDSRLTAGSFGFLEEGSQRTEVQSVRISFPR